MSNIINKPGWANKPLNNLILEMARETSFPWVAEVQALLDKLEEFKFRGSTRETVFSLINKDRQPCKIMTSNKICSNVDL